MSAKLPVPYQRAINQDFRSESFAQLSSLKPQDVALFTERSLPECYTIVAVLPKNTQKVIMDFIHEAQEIDSAQFFYSPDQIHLTIIGNIPAKTPLDVIQKAVDTALLNKLSFVLYGVGSNTLCSSVSAYPLFDLFQLRGVLRSAIGESGDVYNEHLSGYQKMGWINYMRYLSPPSNQLLDFLKRSFDRYFCTFTAVRIDVVKTTSKILEKEKSELVFSRQL
jgi:hypothetical protein